MGFNRRILDAEKIISKAELENLYLVQKLPDSKIGEMFKVSSGRIHRLRNKYNIKAIEYYERHHKQELDEKEKSFIVGTLLGDGHLRLRKEKRSYPQLMLEQSVKHREFVFWLKEQIVDWLFDPQKPLKQRRIIDKRTNKIYHSYPFQTICHPVFQEFYDAFYKKGKKRLFNTDILEKYFTLYSFAIWLMDDGTLSKRGRRIKICSHNFTYEENDKLRMFLNKKFDLTAHIRKEKNYYCLDFSKKSSDQISEMLRELVVPSMQYKLVPSETTNGAGKIPKV